MVEFDPKKILQEIAEDKENPTTERITAIAHLRNYTSDEEERKIDLMYRDEPFLDRIQELEAFQKKVEDHFGHLMSEE